MTDIKTHILLSVSSIKHVKEKELNDKNICERSSYLESFTLSKKSGQEMSPSRNCMLKLEALLGMTIAVGERASTTRLQFQQVSQERNEMKKGKC